MSEKICICYLNIHEIICFFVLIDFLRPGVIHGLALSFISLFVIKFSYRSMFVNNTGDTRMERIEDLVYIFLCMNNVVPVNGLNILYQVMVIKF